MQPTGDTEDLGEFRENVRRFLTLSIDSGIACPAFGTIMPPAFGDRARAWQAHCFEHGFTGFHWPREYGGLGLSRDHTNIWGEECARHDVAPYMNFQGIILAAGAILRFGTEEQKHRYLRPTLSGEILWCQLFSEPDAGSDLASLRTRADPGPPGWRVSGQKVWTSTAQLAQQAILLARTDPDAPGSRGISFFCVDMDTPGIEVRPLVQMTGDSEFCEVFLDDVQLPPDSLIGPLHGGWTVAMSVLADERSAGRVGAINLERKLTGLTGLTADAGDSGATPERGPVLRDRVVGALLEGGALVQMMIRSDGDLALGPLTKLASSEFGAEVAELALDAHGPAAMITGDATEPFLYAPGLKLGGGTSEIQRNLIGERLLGLPREPRPASTTEPRSKGNRR